MASVIEQAAADSDVKLITLDPLIETHLHMIISTFEEGNRQKRTEDGVLCSMYGDIGKHESNLGAFRKGSMMYGGMADEEVDLETGEWVDTGVSITATDPAGSDTTVASGVVGTVGSTGNAFLDFSVSTPDTNPDGSPNIFAQCFPCKFRLNMMAEGLPLPDWSLNYQKFIDEIKKFIEYLKKLMDPTNFYADLCQFIDMLRIVCPQDLVLLIAMLNFLLTKYITLSLKFDIDWLALVGIILLPLLTLLVALLDMMISIGMNPMSCLQDLLEFMYSFTKVTGENASIVGDANVDFGTYIREFGAGTEAGPSYIPGVYGDVEIPMRNEMLDESMTGLLASMSSIETLLLSLSSMQIRIPAFFNMLKDILETLTEMMNDSIMSKMQIMLGIASIIRLIGFIKAIIDLIQGEQICTDPTIPLSEDDVKNVINRMRDLSQDNNSSVNLSRSIGLSPVTDISFDDVGNAVVVTNTITNQSTKIPMCLGALKDADRSQINDWIEQLDAID